MKNKCLVTFILLDLLGHPIKNAKYQIKMVIISLLKD